MVLSHAEFAIPSIGLLLVPVQRQILEFMVLFLWTLVSSIEETSLLHNVWMGSSSQGIGEADQ